MRNDANFQKAGRLHSCLIPARFIIHTCCYICRSSIHNNTYELLRTNPCVFLFIILYIYSKHMFFWVTYFTEIPDAIFQKAGRLHSCLIPAPYLFVICFFCYCVSTITKQMTKRRYQPLCVSFYYIIYIVSVCFFENNFYFMIDVSFQKAGRLHSCLIPARQLHCLCDYSHCVLIITQAM